MKMIFKYPERIDRKRNLGKKMEKFHIHRTGNILSRDNTKVEIREHFKEFGLEDR